MSSYSMVSKFCGDHYNYCSADLWVAVNISVIKYKQNADVAQIAIEFAYFIRNTVSYYQFMPLYSVRNGSITVTLII